MTNADKRSVHTDALATLGNVIGSNEKRDAIHIAVEPVEAGADNMKAGDHVVLIRGVAYPCLQGTVTAVGIVDPFLERPVYKGERFWLLVYPRQITSLRHVWEHPMFPCSEPQLFNTEKEAAPVALVPRTPLTVAEVENSDVLPLLVQHRYGSQAHLFNTMAKSAGLSPAELYVLAHNAVDLPRAKDGSRSLPIGSPDDYPRKSIKLTSDFWSAMDELFSVKQDPQRALALKRESENWLASRASNMNIDYDRMMDLASTWEPDEDGRVFGGYETRGAEWEGESCGRDFWEHYANVTGHCVPNGGSIFNCSCS